ncbi:ABC transporter substrate-binding protein [Micromonospora sp. NPDC005203]|uniref:ABC transporter substrate-binding protein n=1 Tax=Micromonospora sp. NPDC005203 TaxID=3364226 RepID=UPI003688B0AE
MRQSGRTARRALAMVTVLIAGVALSGCFAEPAPEVTIFGSWTGAEKTEFEGVLKKFEEEPDIKKLRIKTHYEGHRDVSQVLQVGIERGRPPDVAVLPRVNDLQQYVNAGRLVSLTAVLGADAAVTPQLINLARRTEPYGGDATYGVAIATHLKSLVWYDPAKLGPTPPQTWQEMVDQTRRTIGDQQVRWCLAMSSPPVSGWPGTDWIEDILLHRSGAGVYERWTRGDLSWTSEEFTGAWTTWGDLLADSSPGTDRASLFTTFEMAAKGLFPGGATADGKPTESSAAKGCHLDHQGSFVIREYRKRLAELPAQAPGGLPPFTFFPTPPLPGPQANSPLQEVSDDVAAMFRDTRPARLLMRYLAGEVAQETRREKADGVAFSRRATPAEEYEDPVTRAVAQRLSTSTLCWDGSDLLPATMATAFERAVMVFLKDQTRLAPLLDELEALRQAVPESEWMSLGCVPAGQEET